VVQALCQHRVDLTRVSAIRKLSPVFRRSGERLDDALHTPVNVLDETDKQRQHADNDEYDDEAEDRRSSTTRSLPRERSRHRRGCREMCSNCH